MIKSTVWAPEEKGINQLHFKAGSRQLSQSCGLTLRLDISRGYGYRTKVVVRPITNRGNASDGSYIEIPADPNVLRDIARQFLEAADEVCKLPPATTQWVKP